MAGTVREEAVKLKKNITDLYTKAVDHATLPLNRRGTMVTCEPLEGYPMKVTADAEATTITRCGKNLFDKSESKLSRLSYNSSGGSKVEIFGFEFILPPGTYVLKAQSKSSAKEGYIYGLTYDISGTYLGEWNAAWGTDLTAKSKTFTNATRVLIYDAVNTPANGAYMSYAWATFNSWNIQLEIGKTATEYEPYNGGTFNPGDTIPALPGVNYIFADAGEITVEARVGALELANTIAPAFEETGTIVACEPVEGYPLDVAWRGKNLCSLVGQTFTHYIDYTFNTPLPPGTYYFSALIATTDTTINEFRVTLHHTVVDESPGTTYVSLTNIEGKRYGGKFTLSESKKKFRLYASSSWQAAEGVTVTVANIQIEKGTTATAYEAYAETATITRCGKNLCSLGTQTFDVYKAFTNGVIIPAGNYHFSAKVETTDTYSTSILVSFFSMDGSRQLASKYPVRSSGTISFTFTLPEPTSKIYLYAGSSAQSSANDTATYSDIQIVPGSAQSAFEPFSGGTFNPGETIPALPGVNTIYADTGTVTVTGRADPLAIINKLQAASV